MLSSCPGRILRQHSKDERDGPKSHARFNHNCRPEHAAYGATEFPERQVWRVRPETLGHRSRPAAELLLKLPDSLLVEKLLDANWTRKPGQIHCSGGRAYGKSIQLSLNRRQHPIGKFVRAAKQDFQQLTGLRVHRAILTISRWAWQL
jgi:hypothetical protein